MKRFIRRVGLLLALAGVAFGGVSIVAADTASASCTYNVGNLGFSFSSSRAYGIGGYSAADLQPGQHHCWYGHAWDSGYFTPPGNGIIYETSGIYTHGLSFGAHGWININICGTWGAQNWVYTIFANTGAQVQSGGLPPC